MIYTFFQTFKLKICSFSHRFADVQLIVQISKKKVGWLVACKKTSTPEFFFRVVVLEFNAQIEKSAQVSKN